MQGFKLVRERGTIWHINTNIKPVSNGSHENSLDVCSGQRDSVHVISLELALFTNK